MTWGPVFGLVHIATLLLAAGIIVGLYFLLKNMMGGGRIITLFVLSFAGIVAIVYNLIKWDSPLEYLPLHMCSINAILLPITVATRNKTLGNLLVLWCAGALMALLFTYGQTNYEIFSMTFAVYYFPHILEFAIPIFLFVFKIIELDWRCILSTLLLTIGIYTVVHLCNVGINAYCSANNIVDWNGDLIQVNYMYSILPSIAPLPLFWSIIPHSYWYMYAAIPLVALILSVVYLPSILKIVRQKKTQKV